MLLFPLLFFLPSASASLHGTATVLNVSSTDSFKLSTHNSSGQITNLSSEITDFIDDTESTPGCNAAIDKVMGQYFKTDAGLQILTLDISSGSIVRNLTMSGTPHHPPTFAWSGEARRAYGVVPYEYTIYGIFVYDPKTGLVEEVANFPKGDMDSIGDCISGFFSGSSVMWYRLDENAGESLVFFDVETSMETLRMPGSVNMVVEDTRAPGTLLAIRNLLPYGVELMRLDPLSNTSYSLLIINETTLGSQLRAQDQASLAVSDDGTVWFVASYDVYDPDIKFTYVYRGVFTLARNSSYVDTFVLESEEKLFGEPDQPGTVFVGRLDWVDL